MNISTANHVITRQIQNSNIPFKYQVNLPWNTPVGLPKAFQRKTNWKYWIKYIKPIWCPQQLLTTSVSISRHVPLLLVAQSRECQLLLLPLKVKTAISRMQDVLGRHFRHLIIMFVSHPARLLKTRQLPKSRIVNVRTESMSHNLKLIPNRHNSHGLRTVDRVQSRDWSGDWLGDHVIDRAIRSVSWLLVRSITITDDWLHDSKTGRASNGHLLVGLY